MTIIIFLAGLAVYAGYGAAGLGYLLLVTAASFLTGLVTPRFRFALWLNIGFHALALLLVKLEPVTGLAIAAPMGISYFALRLLSYNIDVYRGKYPPERNAFRYFLYVTYLPNLFLGPIERYDRFVPAAYENRQISWENFSLGGIRILWGLFKKLAISSRAGVLVGTISAAPEKYQGAYALFAVVLYSIQLYTDFSGGIDMVLGVSRMLGIRLSENFDAPFFSQSVSEFWRRWHITLGSWLRDYVYISLGGNRKGKMRKFLNTLITFSVSGLWHGVHYTLWGVFNGIFVSFGERLKTPVKLLNRLGTFLAISVLWAFFVWPDTVTAMQMLLSMFTTFNYSSLFAGILELGLNGGEWIVLLVSTMLLLLVDGKKERFVGCFRAMSPAGRVAVACTLGMLILVFGMYGIGFNAEEFIYSRF